MKTTMFLILVLALPAFADQAPTMTCTGEKVILTVKSPYWGENSKVSQELYVLKSKDANDNETAYTAFFLDVEPDMGKFGTQIFTGRNSVGGSFELMIKPWMDESDGTTVRETSVGALTYKNGPLEGDREAVNCVRE